MCCLGRVGMRWCSVVWHDKLRFQGGAHWRGNLPKCFGRAPSLELMTSPTALHVGEQVQATKTEFSRNKL